MSRTTAGAMHLHSSALVPTAPLPRMAVRSSENSAAAVSFISIACCASHSVWLDAQRSSIESANRQRAVSLNLLVSRAGLDVVAH